MLQEQEYQEPIQQSIPEQAEEELIQIPEPEEQVQSEPEAQLSSEEQQLFQEEPEAEEEPQVATKKPDLRYRLHQSNTRAYAAEQRAALLEQQLAEERAAMQAVVEAERQSRQKATEAANYFLEAQYDEKIKLADQKIRMAHDLGDVEALEKARDEKTQAQIAKAESERWRNNQAVLQERAQEQQPMTEEQQQYTPSMQEMPMTVNPYAANQPLAQQWANDNASWLHPDSPEHDAEFTGIFENWLPGYEETLRQRGLGHMIGSPEFFETVQTRVEEGRQELAQLRAQSQPQQRREPQMKYVQSGVAPVRGGRAAHPQGQQRPAGVFQDQRARDFFNGLNQQGKVSGRWDQVQPQTFQKKYEEALAKIRNRNGLTG